MEMKHLVFIFVFLATKPLFFSQNLRLVSNLPSYLNEKSGLVAVTENGIWTHNDGGDGPILYKIDTNGNLLDSIYLNGISNIDFEDVTQDNSGNFYIGDVGNNNHNRTNLVIYKIPNPDSIVGNNVTPKTIYYNYPDQLTFPDTNHDKDCEALFHYNGNLYLLSKNWGSSGFSTLYQLPDTAETFSAIVFDSIQAPLVTGAAIHPSGILAILSMDRVVIFDQFSGNDFFNGRKSTFLFSLTQKEGVSFVDAHSLYISQEHNSFFPGAKLYELVFSPFLSSVNMKISPDIQAMPNPATETLLISVENIEKIPSKLTFHIYNMKGKLVSSQEFDFTPEFTVFLSEMKPGVYLIKLTLDNYSVTKRFIKN